MSCNTGDESKAMETRISNQPAFPLQSVAGGPIVFLIVGGERHHASFIVHEELLRAESEVFKRMCDESKDLGPLGRVLKMPEDDPVAMEFMISWLYPNGGMPRCVKVQYSKEYRRPENEGRLFPHFVRLYVLAEKYDMTDLCDYALDLLITELTDTEEPVTDPFCMVPYVYENTHEFSPLRTLFVNTALMEQRLCRFEELIEESLKHPEFLAELVKKQRYRDPMDFENDKWLGVEVNHCARFHLDYDSEDPCQELDTFKIVYQ